MIHSIFVLVFLSLGLYLLLVSTVLGFIVVCSV